MKKLKNKKAFTLIELIVVIAVLGVLVLLGAPKLLGHVQKAELTRIQHDTKVMEQEMELALLDEEVNMGAWDDNAKDLGLLVVQNKLYEKEGFASNVNKDHLIKHFEGNSVYSLNDDEALNSKVDQRVPGIGGDLIPLMNDFTTDDILNSEGAPYGYKVVPKEYTNKINSKLKGTFYSNPDGKVYYENDKALTTQKNDVFCEATIAEDDGYTFEVIDGKGVITNYDHRSQHIVIPSAFKVVVDGEEVCWPVQVIGRAAFAYGPLKELVLKEVVIPDSVKLIEEEAFKENDIERIVVPHSVEVVEEEAFNGVGNVIIVGSPNPSKSYMGGGGSVIYRGGTPKDHEVIFDKSTGTIVGYYGGGPAIEIPSHIYINGVGYAVKRIAKGAYQGQGLISVILPETLERIEAYAFSGNQLVGITIPNSVVYIGEYAFSFNEVTHSITGRKKASMKTIIMKDEEQINKLNDLGDIMENEGGHGNKINLMNETLVLREYIFVTSIGNNVEFVEEPEAPEEPEIIEPEIPEDKFVDCVGPIKFSGIDPEVCDGDTETHVSFEGTKNITWTGNLDNKEIKIDAFNMYNTTSLTVKFYNDKEELLTIPSHSNTSVGFKNNRTTESVIVPKGAVRMEIYSHTTLNKIYEITVPDVLNEVKTQDVTSSSTDSTITLKWNKEQRVVILKDEIKIADGYMKEYTDVSLQPNTLHNYRILFLDEFGNGSSSLVGVSQHTENRDILFHGLDPVAWDRDTETYVSFDKTKNITWTGNLDNKEIKIDAFNMNNTTSLTVKFYNDKDELLTIPSHSNTSVGFKNNRTTESIIVPKGAVRMEIYSYSRLNKIYEITVPDVLNEVETQDVTSSSTDSTITLKWNKEQRVVILKDEIKIADGYMKEYTDVSLQPNTLNNYRVLFLDEFGNGSSSLVDVSQHTENRDIVFHGLDPVAWDRDTETYVSFDKTKNITWTGNLDNKEIKIEAFNMNSTTSLTVKFYNDKDELLTIPSHSNTSVGFKNNRTTESVIVPKGAVRMEIYSYSRLNKIYEITEY